MTDRLRSESVTLTYGEAPVVRELSIPIPEGSITSIIGPNGCGKSTLLRALAHLMRPSGDAVYLDGQLIHHLPTREVAKRLGLLHQQTVPPNGLLVEDLVRRGRYPHQSFLQPPSRRDAEAVEKALELTGMTELRRRAVDQLSGGQRQRAWVGMALAQDTPVLLLDEPTTFLDIAAQIDLLDLVRVLNREEGRTVVMILHDLNLAARYANWLVAMKDGAIVAAGPPSAVISDALLRDVFAIEANIVDDPRTGTPLVLPNRTLSHGLAQEDASATFRPGRAGSRAAIPTATVA
ncbi:MAG: ABC transporter ATP-binding protein [Thermomicrobiales bacterium]